MSLGPTRCPRLCCSFVLPVYSCSGRSNNGEGSRFGTMEDARGQAPMEDIRDQASMGVGHLEPDTSSDDFAEDVCRKSAHGRNAATGSHTLADI